MSTSKNISNKATSENARILAQGVMQCNDTRITGLNNNDLIIGSTGAGKTRGYVIPNLVHNSGESLIVVDTKGNLHKAYGDHLRAQGYDVRVIDFVDCLHSKDGYDPIRFIKRDEEMGRFVAQDILRVSAALCPVTTMKQDPYWDQAAQMNLASIIALTLERFEDEDHSMATVCQLVSQLGTDWLEGLFEDLELSDPDSFAVYEHRMSAMNKDADKMTASILGILANALNPLSFDGAKHLYSAEHLIDFASLGHEKTALFVTVSDNDRSLDRLLNVFYTQAIQELVREADRQPSSSLPIPVRLILDDFAAGAVIPDFDKVITTIRSRGIAVSLIVQDLTQLGALYGDYVGAIIANNCDTWLYLGGQDVDTAEKLSKKLGKPVDSVLSLGLDEVFLLRRGSKPLQVQKYDLSSDGEHESIIARPQIPAAEADLSSVCEHVY